MKIEWQIASQEDWRADAVVFFLFEKREEHPPWLTRFLAGDGHWLGSSPALDEFAAKPNEVAVLYAPAGMEGIPRVLLAGLGPAEQFGVDKLRNAAAFALRKCRDMGLSQPAIPIAVLEGLPCDTSTCLREALTGAIAGLHRFNEMKTRNSECPPDPDSILLLSETPPGADLSEIHSLVEAEAAGIILARVLTISPANRVTPAFLSETASDLSARFGFKVSIIDFDSAKSMGMGAFCAVAQGSGEPAYLILIEHTPEGTENDAPIVFIGKGITFDTGGISLKPGDRMEAMKQDMAGAAAVLGTFEAIGRSALRKRVIGILPCTENMPGGRAYKPGDVIRSHSGQTIEVISTDAEGRMVLCDALSYAADRFNPAVMIDIATLTGACIIALGKEVAAVLGNREDLVRSIQDIGAEVGERFWPLPLWDFYFDSLKSEVADMKNVGERAAGTIIGAIFLKQFVPKEIPWAHLDIAGTAWTEKDSGAVPKGASGFGVRTMFEFARRWKSEGAL